MKPVKWTLEVVVALARQYIAPSHFKKANPSAYKALRRYGKLEEIYPQKDRVRHAKFTEVELLKLMKECITRSEFQVKHPSAYNAARKLDIIVKGIPFSHKNKAMGREPYPDSELIAKAKEYSTIKEWAEQDSGSYQVACRRGIVASHGPKPLQGVSAAEKELLDFLKSLQPDFTTKRFGNDYELDCYSEILKLGVEYNGLYWHSEAGGKCRSYHLNKTKYFEELGIRVIHIWEHEWRDRNAQVKDYLKSACSKNTIRIGARKCVFKEIDSTVARQFLNETHIQGGKLPSVLLAIGCFYKEQLVGVCSFGKHHRDNKTVVLNRFACLPDYTVSGFLAKASKIASEQFGCHIYSWADYSKSQARGYQAAGWEVVKTHSPDYFYCDSKAKVISKQSRRKSAANTPTYMTEKQHATKDGLYRIWDCGKILLIYKSQI